MLCNQYCYDMMLFWDSLLLRAKSCGNTALPACLPYFSLVLNLGTHVLVYASVYMSMCLAYLGLGQL